MSFAALQTQGLFAEAAKLIQNPHALDSTMYFCGFQRWRERELSLKGQSLQRVIAKYSNVIANEVRDSSAVAN